MMYEPKRLHPAAMIISVISTIRQTIFGLLPLIVIAINTDIWKYVLLGVGVLLLLIIVSSVLTWFRYTYTLEEDQIRIEQGVIVRKKRTISKHRIQSIDLSQNIVHRILGLTKVQIETAGNDHNIDAALHAVTMEEGKRIHDQLKYTQQPEQEYDSDGVVEEQQHEEKRYPTKKITPASLLIAGSTSGGFGVVLGLAALAFSQIETFIPDDFYDSATSWVVSQAVQVLILLVVLALIIVWCIGVLFTVIQNWDFTIKRYEKELFITRGLLEKKQTTIPLRRIQAVGIHENIVRQPLGFATVYVEIASGEVYNNNNTTEMHTVIFPLIKKKDVTDFLEVLLPEYKQPEQVLTKLPKKAIPYYLLRVALLPIIASIIVAFVSPNFVFIPLIITGLALLLGWVQYKTTGFAIVGNQLTLQTRMMNKDTVFVLHKRLQSFQRKQHILHRKQQLASFDTAILNKFTGRHLIIKELRQSDVDTIADWYSYEKRNSAPSSS